MKFIVLQIFFALFVIPICMVGQNIGAIEIEEKKVSSWMADDIKAYEGIYHFGEGDGSNMTIIINDTLITAQINQRHYWSEGGYALEGGYADLSELDMKWEFKNLTGIKIKNGTFYSDQYQGEFISYADSTGTRNGLKVINPWNEWIGEGRYEIGLKWTSMFDEYFDGKFSFLSYRMVGKNQIDTLDTKTLHLMRNEIYARYGYKFKKGSKMALYFNKQEWYHGKYTYVNTFITAIELANIELIKHLAKNNNSYNE